MSEAGAGSREPIGFVAGRITIVQEDRIRMADGEGRGYLFVVRRGAASIPQLEAWRDEGTFIGVEYRGQPDAGALALGLRPLNDLEAQDP